jgi:hypothetical protein
VTGDLRHCRPVFRLLFRERDVSILPVPGKDSIRTLGFFQVCVLYQPKGTKWFSGKDKEEKAGTPRAPVKGCTLNNPAYWKRQERKSGDIPFSGQGLRP